MKLINFLLFLMLSSDQVQGSIKTMVVPAGGNLSLFLTEDELPTDYSSVSFFFDSNTIVTFYPDGKPPNVAKNYKGSVDVSSVTLVILMNLNKSDSGVYSAVVTEQDKPFKQYKVIVQDGVSPVNLTDSMFNITTHEQTVTRSTGDFNNSGTLTTPNQTQPNVTTQHPLTPDGSKTLHDFLVGGGYVLAAVAVVAALYFILKKLDLLPEWMCNISSNLCKSPKQEDPLSTSSNPQSSTPFLEEPQQPVNGRIDEQIALTPLCPSSSDHVTISIGSPTSQ